MARDTVRIKRMPLEYPNIPAEANVKEFKGEIRRRYDSYIMAVNEIEKAATEMMVALEKQYNEAIVEYMAGVSE